MMCHRDLLLRLFHRLDALKQARTLYAPILAPKFNAIGLFGPDELRLSQLLKELLSPTGSHAQGSIFLELFLQRYGLENFLPIPNNVEVSTEKTTDRLANTMRRMDVYLDFGSAAITIENKPWTGDQQDQCKDYLAQLTLSHPSLNCLLYLSGSGEPPSHDSISEIDREQAENDGRFIAIGYTQLIDWLKECRRECQAERVNVFLSEFTDYIQKEFVGLDMTDTNEIADIVLKDTETLQAALELAHPQNDIKRRLLEQLKNQLEDKLDNWELSWGLNTAGRYSGFNIDLLQSKKYAIRFQFDGTQYNALGYGVCKIVDEKLPDLPEVRDCLNNIATGKQYPWWPWWCKFPSPYFNWGSQVEPWLDIKSGKMADMIIEKTKEIYDALSVSGLLEQLSEIHQPKRKKLILGKIISQKSL